MTAAPVKITALPRVSSLREDELLVVVTGASGNSATRLLRLSDLTGNSSLVGTMSAPANSTSTAVTRGAVLTDGSYLYVATANNILKRTPLSTF